MIKFDYAAVQHQVNKLQNISDELTVLIQRQEEMTDSELRNAWKGESADLFFQKYQKLSTDIQKTAKRTARAAERISATAKVMKETEEMAQKIVSK